MWEAKDVYEELESKQDDATKQKLSTLQENIKSHISSSPLQTIENSVTWKSTETKFWMNEIIGAVYAKRMSKDIIVKYVTGSKNEQDTLWGKLKQIVGDKVINSMLKQENSYDAILMNQEALVIQKFQWELTALKSKIVAPINDDAHEKGSAPTNEHQTNNQSEKNEWYAESSHYTDEEKKQIDAVITGAKKFKWTKYVYGGNGKKGIDCSWLWSAAFGEQYKDEGKTFGRLTAALFDTKATDITRNAAERWDWMFWEDPKGIKEGGRNDKWQKIYHIEMALGKPFEKDGKRYIKTYGSSSDENITDANGVPLNTWKDGVGYRIREIKDNHHFAKPPYYEKLVAMKKADEQENKNVG